MRRVQFATVKHNRFVVLTYYCSKLIVTSVRIYFKWAQEIWVRKKRFPADYFFIMWKALSCFSFRSHGIVALVSSVNGVNTSERFLPHITVVIYHFYETA